MAIAYEIEDNVLILKSAPEGFPVLRRALDAAATHPDARPKMPLLIDVRADTAGVRYDDVPSRVALLGQMRETLGARWAILMSADRSRPGILNMFAMFTEMEGLESGMFLDKDEAMKWLREQI